MGHGPLKGTLDQSYSRHVGELWGRSWEEQEETVDRQQVFMALRMDELAESVRVPANILNPYVAVKMCQGVFNESTRSA